MSAFEAFIDGHYDRVAVPAQSAVEIGLMPVVRELLEGHASVDHVKGFMGDRLTFGNVINVLLRFVCGQAGLPGLGVHPRTLGTFVLPCGFVRPRPIVLGVPP